MSTQGDGSVPIFFGLSGRALFFSVALAVLVVSRSLLVTASKDPVTHKYAYDAASVVMITELMKFLMAGTLYLRERSQKASKGEAQASIRDSIDTRVALLYCIPAVIYAVQNNLVFVALSFLPPPIFELFANLKIVTTAIVFRLTINKPMTNIQWTSIILLFFGAILGQLGNDGDKVNQALATEQAAADQFIGFWICLAYAMLSAVAGVFTEKLLKESKQSAHLQNLEIYAWSMLINAMIFKYNAPERELFSMSLLDGYDGTTWLVVVNGALMGQCVSFVMKYADNLVKTFAACLALFLSTLLSAMFFSFAPSLLLFIGFGVTSVSLYLYFGNHNKILLDAEKASNGGNTTEPKQRA